MPSQRVMEWLLDDAEPSIRYLALRQLEGKSESDAEVRDARKRIPTAGWAAQILAERDPGGWWVHERNLYVPKYLATNWRLLVLSDLGVARNVPAVRESCELWMDRWKLRGGGIGGNSNGQGHHCITANMTRALIRLGYANDPRIRKSVEWLVRTANPKGGWSCWSFGDRPSTSRNLDSWEGLSVFAAYPRSKWTPAMQGCAERGAEFFLERELHRQGERYAPWYRFHYPVHYYYDVLVGLDLLTALGYSHDRRLASALALLRRKRRTDGRWNLDAIHPDVAGATAAWYQAHPRDRPTPWGLEAVGGPSRMITLIASRVLARVDGTAR